ncbi:MAG: hypothetical protein CVV21_11355 [Candidatus Goldiibacteriota bacterium HGW-Goldbacteria-1]|jgi:hypothetical protein|nr:MAG: hypothetical protein CVV21_11355 [Candidatus Goldiibacteriota bacterium HGW-Goldbacteria-1]
MMKKFVFVFIMIAVTSLLAAADEYLFDVTVGGKTSDSIWIIDKRGGDTYLYNNIDGVTTTAVNTPDGETLRFTIDDDKNNIHIKTERMGNDIFSMGVFKGNSISKTVKSEEGKPLYQYIFVQGGSFALSKEKSQEFAMVRPFDFEVFNMKLEKKGNETIDVLGKPTETVKVEMRMAGFLSVFWSADFWFRTSDGAGVKYRGPQGPPGSPEVNIKLIKETHK